MGGRVTKIFIGALLVAAAWNGYAADTLNSFAPPVDEASRKISSILHTLDVRLPLAYNDLKPVEDVLLNKGLWSSPLHASVLLLWASAKEFSPANIDPVVDVVMDICPSCPSVLYRAGRLEVEKGGIARVPSAMVHFLKGWFHSVGFCISRLLALPPLFELLAFSIIIALFFVVLVDLFLNSKTLAHFMKDWLFMKGNALVSPFLILALAGLPIAVGFGADMAIIILLATSLIWTPVEDRVFLRVAAAFVIIAALFMGLSRPGYRFLSDSRTTTFLKFETFFWDNSFLKQLESLASKDTTFERVRGIYLLKSGRYAEAIGVFDSLTRKTKSPADYVNAGVAFFASGMDEQALASFQKALKLAPRLVSAHYNIAQYYYRKAKVFEGEKELNTAKDLNPQRVSFFTKIFNKDVPLRSLMIEEDTGFSYPRVFFLNLKKGLADLLLPYSSFTSGLLISGICVIFLLIIAGTLNKRFATAPPVSTCNSCGVPYCANCLDVGTEEEGYCNACHAIFLKKVATEAEARQKKEIEVRAYRRRNELFMGTLSIIPGLAHIYMGRRSKAFVYLFFLILLGGFILLRERFDFYFNPHALSFTPGQVLAAAGMLMVYVIMLIDVRLTRG